MLCQSSDRYFYEIQYEWHKLKQSEACQKTN